MQRSETPSPTPTAAPASSAADTTDHGSQLAWLDSTRQKLAAKEKEGMPRVFCFGPCTTCTRLATGSLCQRGSSQKRSRKGGGSTVGYSRLLSEPSVGFFFPHSIALGIEMGQFSDKHWVDSKRSNQQNTIRNMTNIMIRGVYRKSRNK